MASGTLVVTAVSGSGPYAVTVQDAGSLSNSDHFGAPTSSGDGVWVVSSLSGNSFTATDSLDPDGGTYGAPTTGSGWYTTPGSDGISPIPKAAANWRAADIRNAKVAVSSTVVTTTAGGRLSLSSSDPLGEASGAASLYYLPYSSEQIALYSGSTWSYATIPTAGVSVAFSGGTASKPHDVFIYDSAGTLTLDLVAWTDGTTRATALTRQDGVYVKSGATSRRFLGTVYLDGSKQCTDSGTTRHLQNWDNRVQWGSSTTQTVTLGSSWANANTSLNFDTVTCLAGTVLLDVFSECVFSVVSGAQVTYGVEIDWSSGAPSITTSAVRKDSTGVAYIPASVRIATDPGIGRHTVNTVCTDNSTGTSAAYTSAYTSVRGER